MLKYVYLYLATIPVFFAIDMLWLGLIAKDLYRKQFGSLLKDQPNWPAAFAFYLLFILGLLIFATVPALEKRSLQYALVYGAMFGFFCYATFDLTGYAVLKGFPLWIIPVDLAWGAILSASVAGVSYWIGQKFFW